MTNKSYLPEVIICGYERGGTTLISEWLRRSGFSSYFEIGCLLCKKSSSFPKLDPYFAQLTKDIKRHGYENNNIDCSTYESIYKSIFSDLKCKRLYRLRSSRSATQHRLLSVKNTRYEGVQNVKNVKNLES